MEAVLALALYFVPSLVASMRRHHQTAAIFLTNLLLGWTVIGWIVALIWSATAVDPSRQSRSQRASKARLEHTKSLSLTDTSDPYMPDSLRRWLERRRAGSR